jgi:ABC-2 type transport system permease protein
MATNLKPIKNSGPFAGFGNMLKIEGSRWLSPRTLITQSLAWLFAINFIVAMPLIVAPIVDGAEIVTLDMATEIFIGIFSVVVAVGTIIVMQSSLVGEKQSGTAAWILTNPITRTSFIMSKLLANTLGLLFVAIALQGAVGYGILSYALGYALPIQAYLASMGLQVLHMLFYITLTMALGAFFESRGPIMGIGIMVVMIQDLLSGFLGSYLPWFPNVLPKMLNVGSIMLVRGQALPTSLPIIATAVYTVALAGLAIWRFKRTEF